MNVWIVIKSGYKDNHGIIVNFTEEGFTSLKSACASQKLNYSSASKGKRVFTNGVNTFILKQIKIQRIKGRENNHKKNEIITTII